MQTPFEPPQRASLVPLFAALAVWTLGAALTPWLGVWGGVGGAALLVGAGFALAYPKAVGPLCRLRRELVVQGFVAGVVMISATYLLFPVACKVVPSLQPRTRELYHLFNSGPAALRFLLPLVIVGEEVVWRGIVQGVIARRVGVVGSAVATAVIYALAHAPVNVLLVLVALCCGLYWGLLRARTGSLVPSLLAHLMWDLMVMVWLPLLR